MPKLFKIFTIIISALIALVMSLSLLSALTASASSIEETKLGKFEPAPLAPLFATGGADNFGYTYQDEEEIPDLFDFSDVSTGTNLNLDDEGKASLVAATTLAGFDFEFYGQTLSSLVVSNNGLILVNPTINKVNFTNSCDISSVYPDQRRFIAPWWDDWGDTGDVYWALQGSAPNRRLIIQWDNMIHASDTGSDGVTFQVVFYENSNIIEFNYDDATTASPYSQGNSGTIGIMADDVNFLQYRTCNGGNPLQDSRAVRFSVSSITVFKQTLPDEDSETFDFSGTGSIGDFSLTDGLSQTFFLVPGVYTLAETLPTGWDVTNLSCSGNATPAVTGTVTATVTLGAAEEVVCTFENTKRGSITIAKDATPNSSQVFTFTGDLTPSFTLADSGAGSNSRTFPDLLPGTYTVTEAIVGGWTLAAISCDDGDGGTTGDEANRSAAIDLDPGQDITCTFENSQLGTLSIRKVTDPDPDHFTTPFTFTASPSLTSTPFSLTNGQVFTFKNVVSGAYAITETAVADWTTDSNCSNKSSVGNINVGVGEAVTCVFTNTAAPAELIVDKVTVPPGNATEFEFELSGGPESLNVPFVLSDTTAPFTRSVKAGNNYIITETKVLGNWVLTEASCDNGADPRVDSISVRPNDRVRCVFTNTAKFGAITVKKVTLPSSSQLFTFTNNLTSTDFTLTNGQTRTFTVTGSSVYSIAETVPAGWVLTDSACDNGKDVSSITALGGQNITCTFTNTQDIGTVTIVKETIPDGSPQVFTFTTNLTNTGNFTLTDNLSRTFVVASGSYTVAEQTLDGWSLTTPVTCSDESSISNLNLQIGEAITCTFANKQSGALLVKKVKVPSTESPTNFSFSVTEDSSPFRSFSLAHNGTSSPLQVDPDKDYRVTESTVAGWSTVIGCTNGQTVTNGNRYVDISPQAGQTITCTFTNTKQTRLSIRKVTIPSPDPTGSSFAFTTSAGLSPASFNLSQSGPPRNYDVITGTFTITEAAKAGWNLTDISCTKPGFVKDISAGSVAVSIVPGDNNVTCVFTNTLQSRTITLLKQTVPATNTDSFNFTTNMSPTNFVLSHGLSQTFTVYPGSGYTVTEQSLADWQMSATCDKSDSTLDNISVAIGEDVTCTITNTQVIEPDLMAVYLPLLVKASACSVDLRVNDLSQAGGVVSVAVENTGDCATDSGFWVDLYANPPTLPSTLVGVTADRRWRSPAVNASHGLAWEVPALAAGQTIILTSDGSSGPQPTDGVWPPSPGATIYAYVDSFDNNDPDNETAVEIPETDEFNNLSPAVVLAASGTAASDVSPTPAGERRDVD
jgi:hypothetical protein